MISIINNKICKVIENAKSFSTHALSGVVSQKLEK